MVSKLIITRSNSQQAEVQKLIFSTEVLFQKAIMIRNNYKHTTYQQIRFTPQMQVPTMIVRRRNCIPIGFNYNDLGRSNLCSLEVGTKCPTTSLKLFI